MKKGLQAATDKPNSENAGSHARHSNRIKSLYLSKLIKDRKISEETLIINEFANFYSGARADIAVVTNEYTEAVEIKSSSDSLKRLNKQIQTYLECFNKVTIVTEVKHLDNVIHIAADTNVGIVLFDGANFKNIKRSRKSRISEIVIGQRLTPQRPGHKYIRHDDYIKYIRGKYAQNMEYVRSMIEKGHATELDVSKLNPSHVKRERFSELENSIDRTWEQLTIKLQVDPILFSKAGN